MAHTAGLITAEIFVAGNVAVETVGTARNWNAQHTYVRWETDASPTLDYYLVNITDGQGGVGAAEWRTVQVKTSYVEVFDMPPPVGVTWSWYTLTNEFALSVSLSLSQAKSSKLLYFLTHIHTRTGR
jgi:hypothetical protein